MSEPSHPPRPTIFALSSGRPPAGVAVIRISGPRVSQALRSLGVFHVEHRAAALRTLRDPDSGEMLDRALVLAFNGPHSFTGEDVAELHVHGGLAVVSAVLDALGRIDGLRLAEPGEFSRRAFDNGKLDLSQAEGLADLIDAQTDAQRKLALAQAGGLLRERAESWRSMLLHLLAEMEASLDFAEEEADVAAGLTTGVTGRIEQLAREIGAHLADNHVGERLRSGLTIAIVGPPNAGKSSLMNALARRDVAIVSAIPGTTRDTIELPLDLGGVPVTLIDTAGLRETDDPIEAEGVRRARERASHADLVLHVTAVEPDAALLGVPVVNKIDLSGVAPGVRDGIVYLSAATGAGMSAFESWLKDWSASLTRRSEPPIVTRARHRKALESCVAFLDEAAQAEDVVLRAEALRLATRALGQLTGRVGVDDMLDEIFGRFCIGK